MTNNLPAFAPIGGGLMTREDLARSLDNAAMSMPSAGGGNPYLKMDKDNGKWLFGVDGTPVELDSLWAADPTSLKQGWVAWDSNKGGPPVQEIMVPAKYPLPDKGALPALGMSAPHKKTGKVEQLVYQRQDSVIMVCLSGADEGVQVEFKQSSGGAMRLFAALINAIKARVDRGADEIVPVGRLFFESYPNETYGGTTRNPLFNIVEWRRVDDTTPVEAKAKAPVEEEAPEHYKRTRTAAAPAPEPDAEEAELREQYEAAGEQAPRRRTRR